MLKHSGKQILDITFRTYIIMKADKRLGLFIGRKDQFVLVILNTRRENKCCTNLNK